MDNKERELIEAEIKRIQDQIQEKKDKIKENEQIIRKNRIGFIKNKIKIFSIYVLIVLHKIWHYISFIFKIPIYPLLCLYIILRSAWDIDLRNLIMKIGWNFYRGENSDEDLDLLFNHMDKIKLHITFIFYILLLVWYLYF